jgi:acetyl-CoA/propionyl-CoA carboxylase biotin carboxyl carrier protein
VFGSVLVAGRGEIAVRVIRTLRALGIRAVAVYSDADARARHVREADVAVRLGPPPAAQSYLLIDAILDAAERTGAQAVHPGYGFLAENPAFARACAKAALVFIGPPAEAIEAMGDKIRAKQAVRAAGVPVVPGSDSLGLDAGRGGDDETLAAAAAALGYPVLIKPSAGGGGKGMRAVRTAAELPAALAGARREALGAFGDDTLLIERLISAPRHIEIQVLADAHGAAVYLGERECSLQRRHQKIVEEAPSVLLGPAARARMGASAVAVAQAVGYVGAGTVEFIVPGHDPDVFFFLEMNTRLQVEHPVTELVTGLDLVELQLRVAAGEPLALGQPDVRFEGHAVQARIYAESVSVTPGARGFLPTGGRVLAVREPAGPGVRVDSGLAPGDTVGSDYDPMLAKIIAQGPDRDTALRRLDAALARTTVLGLGTNIGFLRMLLADPDVVAGRLDTGLVERRLADWVAEVPDDVLAAAGLLALLELEPPGPVVDPFALPGGWRIGEPTWTRWQVRAVGQDPVEVRTRGRAGAAEVAIGPGAPVPASARWDCALPAGAWAPPDGTSVPLDGAWAPPPGADLVVTLDGITRRYAWARDGAVLWLGRDGHGWELREHPPLATAREADTAAGSGPVRAPMPGTVTVLDVAPGQQVPAGTRLLVIEAMKMEHPLVAPVDGVVHDLRVRPGDSVDRDSVLLTLVSG